jgi:hypothetical protein
LAADGRADAFNHPEDDWGENGRRWSSWLIFYWKPGNRYFTRSEWMPAAAAFFSRSVVIQFQFSQEEKNLMILQAMIWFALIVSPNPSRKQHFVISFYDFQFALSSSQVTSCALQ